MGRKARKLKGAVKSKTMIVNGLVTAAAVADIVAGNAGIITAIVPGAAPLIAGLGLINMVLRAVTNSSLEEKAG